MFGFKSRRRLKRENATMREALLWYAAKETWRRKGIHQKGAPRKKWRKSPAAFDRGSLANRVLTLMEGPRAAAWSVVLSAPVTVPAPLEAVAEEAKPGTALHYPAPEAAAATDTE